MKFNIPFYIEKLINILNKNEYEAYIVGGSIRDLIIGRDPSDYDIATDAHPDEIQRLFKDFRTLEVGKSFGTIIVVQEEGDVEITTFRTDGEYLDGRRPEKVYFSKDIVEDLSRRDFTINAMAYNMEKGLIDPFNGQNDIENKIIRTVGNPEERFAEDYLRILRAIRFATELNFNMEENTYNSCKSYGNNLLNISMERITKELFKILLSPIPSKGIRLLEELNILEIILPEIIPSIGFDQQSPHHHMDIYEHILCVLDKVEPILHLRLAALFHDIAKPFTFTMDDSQRGRFYGHDKEGEKIAKDILIRWKTSNELISKVSILIKEHMTQHSDFKRKGLKRLINRVGEDEIFNLIKLQRADRICSNNQDILETLNEREEEIREILNSEEAYNKNQLAVDGNDIIQLGYSQGKIIGEILDYLLEKVLESPELNHKDKLISITIENFPK